MTQLTFLSEEPLAKASQSLDFENDLVTHAGTLCSPILPLLQSISPSGWFGRTSPASCHQTKDGILAPFSERWGNSGMGFHGEALTLNTSVWPKDAGVCSLSDTLETGNVPQRFFLSAKACQGILRRAKKRGKKLPEQLLQALSQVAQAESQKAQL